jgi:molecular chaperone DnaJ
MTEDLYKILNLERDATPNDIKKAYRKLAKKYHPDVTPDDKESEAMFKKVAYAYEILSDTSKKEIYDVRGHDGLNGAHSGQPSAQDIENLFRNFGFARHQRSEKDRHSLSFKVNLTPEEVYTGVKKHFTYNRVDSCTSCNGDGGENPSMCTSCNGTGQIIRIQQGPYGHMQQITTCNTCKGLGVTFTNECTTCNGHGKYKVSKEAFVDIEIGVVTGEIIGLPNMGHIYGNNLYGDLILTVQVINSPKFSVFNHYSLISKLNVPYEILILGGKVEFITIDGSIVKIPIKKMSKLGHVLRLKDKGLKTKGGATRGDQHLELFLHYPESISKEEKELLEKIKKINE